MIKTLQTVLCLHPDHRLPMRTVLVIVSLLVLGMLLAWAMPPLEASRGIASYLPLHTLLETIAIIIAALVFTVGWNANVGRLSGNIMLLACVFLGVGLLDFSHILSYAGMPDFVTPSGPQKSINFWLVARALAALALLTVAVTPWRPLASTKTRYVLLLAILLFTTFVSWLFLYHSEQLPATFIPGKGLTAFKVGTEYSIIGINIVTALALWIRMGKPQPFNAAALFGAVCVMALSEFFFTLYSNVADIYNVLGHIYKVISYLFIYRAIFVVAIEAPYLRLSESQNQLQTTLEALPDLLFEVDLNGRYYDYHSPNSASYNQADQKWIGLTLTENLPGAATQTLLSALQTANRAGHAHGEYTIEKPEAKRWFEFSVVQKPVSSDQLPRFIVISRDVSERKQFEKTNSKLTERLELATRAAHIGIWDWDIVSNQLDWDERMFELYGIRRSNFGGIYEAWLAALHPDDRAYTQEAIQLALRKEKTYDIEFRIQWPDRSIHHIKASGHVVRDTQDEALRMIGVNFDITERKEAELNLKLLNEELEMRVIQRTGQIALALKEAERANAAKSEFLSRMSHELRTPLNAILGFGQLLETDPDTPLTPLQQGNMNEIMHAGRYLLELINEVLDLSRIESGRLEMNLEPVAVAPLIEASVAQLATLATGRKISFELALGPVCSVQADRMRLREVLINLLSNAIKYNRENGKIRVSCKTAEEQCLRISISDTGQGIAAEALPRLFRPFERLESAYNGIEGSGIGLALAKKLVEAMHGEIGVESIQGEGSNFWFELPLHTGLETARHKKACKSGN